LVVLVLVFFPFRMLADELSVGIHDNADHVVSLFDVRFYRVFPLFFSISTLATGAPWVSLTMV
jgi:hypothetical protein